MRSYVLQEGSLREVPRQAPMLGEVCISVIACQGDIIVGRITNSRSLSLKAGDHVMVMSPPRCGAYVVGADQCARVNNWREVLKGPEYSFDKYDVAPAGAVLKCEEAYREQKTVAGD